MPDSVLVRRMLVALVIVGVVLRVLAPFHATLGPDGSRYALIGKALVDGHGFATPEPGPDGALVWLPDHNYAPLWPAILAVGYLVAGYSVEVTQWVGVLVSLLAMAAIWWATRDLLGAHAAWVVAAIVAVYPRFVFNGASGYSEDLALAFFALTLWAILRSLERPWVFVAAGAFAGLSFLTRAAAGALFIVAGIAGLIWRLRHRGATGITARPYLVGVLVFGAMVGGWTLRNLLTFWDGTLATFGSSILTSEWAGHAQAHALNHPFEFLQALGLQAGIFLVVAAPFAIALGRPLRDSLRPERAREEATSGLWLAVALTAFFALIMGAAFHIIENNFWALFDHERYLTLAIIPLLWLVLRETGTHRDTRRLVGLGIFLAVCSTAAVGAGAEWGEALAADHLGEIMPLRATVNVDRHILPYTLAYYIERDPVFVFENADYTVLGHPPPDTSGLWFYGDLLYNVDAVIQQRAVEGVEPS